MIEARIVETVKSLNHTLGIQWSVGGAAVPELGTSTAPAETAESSDWRELLYGWARNELVQGKQQILQEAVPAFETVMIRVALQHSQGRKRDAAELLGWGRNTLTRKMKELEMDG